MFKINSVVKKENRTVIWGALIAAAATVIASVIGWHPWTEKQHTSIVTNLLFAGTVVDAVSNASIGQAEVTIVGRNEHYYTEDNGNFQIEVKQTELEKIRVRVTKNGYKDYDISYDLPAESIVIPLTKER